MPENTPCDDGDICTLLDKCDADGVCVGPVPDGVTCKCETDADCPMHYVCQETEAAIRVSVVSQPTLTGGQREARPRLTAW